MAHETALSLQRQGARYSEQQHQFAQSGYFPTLPGTSSYTSSPTVYLRPLKLLKQTKQVCFAPMATMITTSAPTEEDNLNSWYTAQDYRSFELENRRTVEAIYHAGGSDSLNPEEISPVGLEQLLHGRKRMFARRLRNKQHAVMVLEMYDVQRCNGVFDPEMVRRLSERFTDDQAVFRAARLANENLSSSSATTSDQIGRATERKTITIF